MTEYRIVIDEPWGCEALKVESISRALETAFPGNLVGGHKVDPENDAKDRSKLGVIKRIRELLNCSLVDAQFLTDTAQTVGYARWGTVRVNAYGAGDSVTYQVVDVS
jgi:ribosomal protein L7/L12